MQLGRFGLHITKGVRCWLLRTVYILVSCSWREGCTKTESALQKEASELLSAICFWFLAGFPPFDGCNIVSRPSLHCLLIFLGMVLAKVSLVWLSTKTIYLGYVVKRPATVSGAGISIEMLEGWRFRRRFSTSMPIITIFGILNLLLQARVLDTVETVSRLLD